MGPAEPDADVARNLDFSMTFNFRDLGGYAGHDGRRVRWRRLFRSDSLHRLGAADRAAFGALGVRTVIDLRRPTEVTRDGRVPAWDGFTYHHIHPEHTPWRDTDLTAEHELAPWLAERYLTLAEEGRTGIGAALTILADERAAPAVVHCVAGKDRTGIVCALTLGLLGVADDAIAEDYALSTEAARRYTAWVRRTHPGAPAVPAFWLASPAQTMHLFLAGLRARHGSIEGYARAAGLTATQVADLRAHLLS